MLGKGFWILALAVFILYPAASNAGTDDPGQRFGFYQGVDQLFQVKGISLGFAVYPALQIGGAAFSFEQ